MTGGETFAQVMLPASLDLKSEVLRMAHDTPVACHMGRTFYSQEEAYQYRMLNKMQMFGMPI